METIGSDSGADFADVQLLAPALYPELDTAERTEIAQWLERTNCSVGEILFRQGDVGETLYVVASGRFGVQTRGEDGALFDLSELQTGDWFGAMGMLTGQPRVNTVTALEDTAVVALSRANYAALAQRYPAIGAHLKRQFMPNLLRNQMLQAFERLFGTLEPDVLHQLEAQVEWVHLAQGEVLMQQGDPSDALYLVATGLLHITVTDGNGEQRLVREIRAWDTLGELGLLGNQPRTATVTAARASDVIQLKRQVFEQFVLDHPRALLTLASTMAVRQAPAGGVGPAPQGDTTTSALTIAVIPISERLSSGELQDLLGRRLGELGGTLMLTSSSLDHLHAGAAMTAPGQDDPLEIAVNVWLRDQESRHDTIVFLADPAWTPWTQRCLRHADRILLAAWAQDASSLRPVEEALAAQNPTARRELLLLHSPETEWASGTQEWLAPRQVATHHHVRVGNREDEQRLARRLTGRGVGLVLGGGGARGLAHVGVLRALEEAGVVVDIVGATSMGAVVGAGYAEYYDAALVAQRAEVFSSVKNIFDRTLPFTSLMKGAKVIRLFQETYGPHHIEDLWRPFFCVSTNLTRARETIHESGPVWLAVRKSMSIPGVFPPVLQDGDVLVDGGVINNFPVDLMRARLDCGTVIGVNVAPAVDKGMNYKFGLSLSGWQILWGRILPWMRKVRAPSLMGTLLRAQEIHSVLQLRANVRTADLMIEPAVTQFRTGDYDSTEALSAAGYAAAQAGLAGWLKR